MLFVYEIVELLLKMQFSAGFVICLVEILKINVFG